MANQDDEEKDEWHSCGVGWPQKKGDGFNLDTHWPLPEGSRLVLMPPRESGKPWILYAVKPPKRRRAPARDDSRGGGRDDDRRRR